MIGTIFNLWKGGKIDVWKGETFVQITLNFKLKCEAYNGGLNVNSCTRDFLYNISEKELNLNSKKQNLPNIELFLIKT